jgi:LPXTG-motif cell wall-anchored protein
MMSFWETAMKKIAFAVVTAFAGLVVTLGLSSPAQAYPDVSITLTANPQVIYSGASFTATTASNVNCSWAIDLDGNLHQGSGTSYATTYVAPKVTEITKFPMTGVCNYAAPAKAGRAKAGALTTWKQTLTITVLPQGNAAAAPNDKGADLPNTGGPNRMFFASGLGLLIAGALAVFVARRRAEEAELPWQTS